MYYKIDFISYYDKILHGSHLYTQNKRWFFMTLALYNIGIFTMKEIIWQQNLEKSMHC